MSTEYISRFDRVEEKGRPIHTRPRQVSFLIFCEGERTEPLYFEGFKNQMPKGSIDLDVEGTARNTVSLVKYAIDKKKQKGRSFDRVWVVFDKDNFPAHNFNEAIKLAKRNKINVAWTNEAFELWYLLHFEYVNTGISRSKYGTFLNNQIRKKGLTKFSYKKKDPEMFNLLERYGNEKQAISWAKKLVRENDGCQKYHTHNPCTYVFELVEEIRNPEIALGKMK